MSKTATMSKTLIGDNITAEVANGELVLRISIADPVVQAAPLSSSGKMRLVANSGGWQRIPGLPFKLNIGLGSPAK